MEKGVATEVVQTVRPSLLHKADSVITVGNGRGFVMEHRVYLDFGDGNGYRKIRRKVLNAFSEIDGSGPSKEAA